MNNLLLWIGRSAGLAGALVCVIAVLTRLSGTFWLAGLQVTTWLLAGMALMLGACLSYVAALAERASPPR
ncbi:MAG: hypothetical protein ABIX46_00140 [Burkholderiaceae bacterium]